MKGPFLKRGAQEPTHWSNLLLRGHSEPAQTSEVTAEATYEATIPGDPQ